MKGPPPPQYIPRTRGMVATTIISWRALPLSTTDDPCHKPLINFSFRTTSKHGDRTGAWDEGVQRLTAEPHLFP